MSKKVIYDEVEELKKSIEEILLETTGKIRKITGNLAAGRMSVDIETKVKKRKITFSIKFKRKEIEKKQN